jgi:hypothetical protein
MSTREIAVLRSRTEDAYAFVGYAKEGSAALMIIGNK